MCAALFDGGDGWMNCYIYLPPTPPQKTSYSTRVRTRARRPDEHDVAAALGQQVDEEGQPHLFLFFPLN